MDLVTGGGGFIGSHIVERLLREGRTVRVFDSFVTGHRSNLESFARKIDVVEGDIRNRAAVQRAVQGCDTIFHQAAVVSVPESVADPMTTYEVNVMGTLSLLEAARVSGCKRVVFASSCAVYGSDPELPSWEGSPIVPASPYASSKLAGEDLCEVYSRVHGLDTVCLRYFNVYGPRQDPSSPYAAVIARFADSLERGDQPIIYGDGHQTRDFVHVEDIAEANLRAAVAPITGSRVYNIGTGRSVNLLTLVSILGHLHRTHPTPIHEAPRQGDVRHSTADPSAAWDDLDFVTSIRLEDGLSHLMLSRAGKETNTTAFVDKRVPIAIAGVH